MPSSGALSQIFQAAVQDHPGAVDQLFAVYRPLLLYLAQRRLRARLRRKVGASDIVQLAEWKAREFFAGQQFATRRNFHAWLFTILDNQLATLGRQFVMAKKRDVARECSLSSPEAKEWLHRLSARVSVRADQLQTAEALEEVMLVFQTLPPHYQLVLRLRYFEMLKFQAIGEQIDRPADAARMLHNRAIVSLREKLQASQSGISSPA
ncbi:MAG: sigma-70 family RNA polymerase sigma factor [Planctomycetaceae bacterium]|nr:sigma-70 family RNA polymerase sigma factor [Planctomycetaceae bacterium]